MENVIIAASLILAGLASGVLTDFVKRFIKTEKKWVNKLITFILAIIATYVAWIIGYIPAFGNPEWLTVLIEGITVGLVAIGLYSDKNLKAFYDFIFSFINGEKWYDKIEKDGDGTDK